MYNLILLHYGLIVVIFVADSVTYMLNSVNLYYYFYGIVLCIVSYLRLTIARQLLRATSIRCDVVIVGVSLF